MLPRLLAPDRPDWRWARIADLSQYSVTQAAARLQSEDGPTRRGFAFQRALDKGIPDEYPHQHAAHYVYHSMPQSRFYIEGMLLAGAEDQRIANKCAIGDSGVIEAYHDLFFAVRPYRENPVWIVNSVFEGPVHRAHSRDPRGIQMRLAWLLGADVFDDLVAHSGAAQSTRDIVRDMVEGIAHARVAEMAFDLPTHGELAPWVTEFLSGKAASDTGRGGGDYEEALGSFLDGLGMSVADPTQERNLELPAREPRATEIEYEVLSDG